MQIQDDTNQVPVTQFKTEEDEGSYEDDFESLSKSQIALSQSKQSSSYNAIMRDSLKDSSEGVAATTICFLCKQKILKKDALEHSRKCKDKPKIGAGA